MEFGLFLILSAVASFGFLRRSITFMSLSIALCFILAIYLSTGQPITQTETTQLSTTTKNATGDILTTDNSTSTKTVNVLSTQQNTVSYIFYGLAMIATFLFVRSVLSGYWGNV